MSDCRFCLERPCLALPQALRKFGALRMAEIKLKSLPPEPKD